MNTETRDHIIFGDTTHYVSGEAYFNGLTVTQLKSLMDNNFISSDGVQTVYQFMSKYPSYTASGHVNQSDNTVNLDGVEKGDHHSSNQEFTDFLIAFGHNEDVDFQKMKCWFD